MKTTVTTILAVTMAFGAVAAGKKKPEWNRAEFDEARPEGNYVCTASFGDAEKPTVNWVKAEGRRLMLEKVVTAPGETVTKKFAVNIRTNDLKDGGKVKMSSAEKGHERWDDRLTVLVLSDNPAQKPVAVEPAPEGTLTLFLAGDSTVCCYNTEPYGTWGQMLPAFFDETVAVANHAECGRSLGSYNSEKREQKVLESMKPGDWLFIQFGHNDQKEKCEFDERMRRYNERLESVIDAFTARGGKVALVSPMERRRFDKDGRPFTTLDEYETAMKAMAGKKGIPFLNLHELSFRLYTALGEEKSKALFGFRKGEIDNTHQSVYGGYELARAMAELIKANVPELAARLRPGIPAWSPEAPDADPGIPRSGKTAKNKPEEALSEAENAKSKGTVPTEKAESQGTVPVKTAGTVPVEALPATAARGLSVWRDTTPMAVGNYDVSVMVGGAAAAESWVKFEGRRIAFEGVKTAPGERKTIVFTARVKGDIAKPGVATAGESPFPHALDVTVVTSGEKPEIVAKPAAEETRVVYLCGDSTVTDQQREPWGSWGQALPLFFKPGAAVANFARSGLHTTSFRQQGRIDRICESLKSGDVVLVQFGHNDQKQKWLKPDANGGYEKELNGYIDRFTEKGAKVVLVTPVERLRFDRKTRRQEGKTLTGYADAVKRVAAARNVPVIDLNDASYRMYAALGFDGAPALLCTYTREDQQRDFFLGKKIEEIRPLADKTHHSIYGAFEMARYIANALTGTVPEIAPLVREEYLGFDPDRPDADPGIPPTGEVDSRRPEGDTGNKE